MWHGATLLLIALSPVTSAVTADVVIYGGTAAGVTAAVQVRRMGRSVALVAPERHLGGMAVEGLGSADVNNHWFRNDVAIGGLAREFYLRIGKKYGRAEGAYMYESHVAEEVVEDLLREHEVLVYREHRLREPLKSSVKWSAERRAVQAIVTETGETFEGRVFLDATLEGDLLVASGVETIIGREPNSKYNETKNGIRAVNNYRQFAVRVDPYKVPGDPTSGLIPTIQDEPFGTPGEGDLRIQAYCLRLCLTRNPANRIAIPRPSSFDRSQYEIYFRYVRAGGSLWVPVANLPNGKTDLGSWHDLSANLYGMNHAWPGSDYKTRDRIYREHVSFTQGLVWLLANDPEMPNPLRAQWRDWGLCTDEFADNGGWPRQLYVRDGRRMVSDYVITEHQTRRINALPVSDPVAVAFWPTDTHHVRRIVKDGAAYNEGFVFDDNTWGPFSISYRALTPRRSEVTNLLTPTCPSSSHVAYGAIRLEQTFMALGQAAATAAVQAIELNKAVQDIPYDAIRTRLLADGQVLALSLVPSK